MQNDRVKPRYREVSEDMLKSVFSNVNDWLKFAEGKLGVLVAVNASVGFGAMTLLGETLAANACVRSALIWLALANGISAAICLASFVPCLSPGKFTDDDTASPAPNLIYFGDIGKFTPDQYLEYLGDVYTESTHDATSSIERDYAIQIVTNSRITVKKYRLFSIGVMFTLIGLAGPLFALAYVLHRGLA